MGPGPGNDSTQTEAASLLNRSAVEEVVARLATDAVQGLGDAEAGRRLAEHGPNELESAPPVPLWRRLAHELSNGLTLILLAATGVSVGTWVAETPRESPLPYEAIAILLTVLLNTVLGLLQEARAENAVRALQALSAPQATVIRGGSRRRIPARDVVPGDLLLVEAGDTVPADARLIKSANLQADESALTGESLPVTKDADPAAGSDEGRSRALFSGTTVTTGRGCAIAVRTGEATEVGQIARMVGEAEKERTPLEKEMDRVGKRLSVAVLILCTVIFVTGVLTGHIQDAHGLLRFALFAVAAAVAAIPEALPTIVTLGLALGTRRMAARNAIIRRLPAVETLGAATVICTDKTGTLTQNRMTVRVIVIADGVFPCDIGGGNTSGADPPHSSEAQNGIRKALRAGALANDASLGIAADGGSEAVALGDAMEVALLRAARASGADADRDRFRRCAEIPFSAERKRHATVHADAENPDQWRVFVKGAPEVLLEHCEAVYESSSVIPMTEARRRWISEQTAVLNARALRTLLIAERTLDRGGEEIAPSHTGIEEGLVFLGLVGMQDPLRPEAADAVRTAQRAGLRIIMATGDHPATALAIAREVGLLTEDGGGGQMLTGPELDALSDEDLDTRVEDVSVYARVAPAHKLRIVRAWQRRGDVVAMTGDGVNDTPALRAADIGIAMGIAGTDAARAAADMVLADDNFATIIHAIEEGRGAFDNIRRCLLYLLECNTGEVLTLFAGIVLMGLSAPHSPGASSIVLPLVAAQILWMNLVTDGPPALALGVEPTAPEAMTRPPRDVRQGILTTASWVRIGLVGLLMAAGTLFLLDAAYPGGYVSFAVRADTPPEAEAHARTLAFTTLVVFQLLNAWMCRGYSGQSAFARPGCSPYLFAALVVGALLHLAVLYVPVLQAAFSTVPLAADDWLLAAVVASSVVIVKEVYTAFRRSRDRRRESAPGSHRTHPTPAAYRGGP